MSDELAFDDVIRHLAEAWSEVLLIARDLVQFPPKKMRQWEEHFAMGHGGTEAFLTDLESFESRLGDMRIKKNPAEAGS